MPSQGAKSVDQIHGNATATLPSETTLSLGFSPKGFGTGLLKR
ncbi:hypothetical protein ABH294_14520 [Acinetobacter pittii]